MRRGGWTALVRVAAVRVAAVRVGVVRVGVVVAGLALLAGCGTTLPGSARPARVPVADLALVRDYVARFNAAADAGPRAQGDFLRATQEPGSALPPARCFETVSVRTTPVESTLRPAPEWTPPQALPPGSRPAGAVYVAATTIDTVADGTALSETVALQHFVVRDGRVYGYAACPG